MRLVALDYLFTIEIDVNVIGLPQHLEPRINTNWLPNTQVEYGVMAIGDILQINKGLSSQIWLVVISLDCYHAVFVEASHSLWKVDVIVGWVVLKSGIVLNTCHSEERCLARKARMSFVTVVILTGAV